MKRYHKEHKYKLFELIDDKYYFYLHSKEGKPVKSRSSYSTLVKAIVAREILIINGNHDYLVKTEDFFLIYKDKKFKKYVNRLKEMKINK